MGGDFPSACRAQFSFGFFSPFFLLLSFFCFLVFLLLFLLLNARTRSPQRRSQPARRGTRDAQVCPFSFYSIRQKFLAQPTLS